MSYNPNKTDDQISLVSIADSESVSHVLFLVFSPQKGRHGPSRVEHIAGTMETGDIKNCGMTQELPRMFREESLGKVNAKDLELFRNRLVHKFYCLKVLITLEQVVEKKKNLNEQNFDQWGRWCG